MDKWRVQQESAHQKGPEIPFDGILTLVGDGLYGG